MHLASQSTTQIYSPFGTYVAEQHDTCQTSFAVPDLPSRHNNCGTLSYDQAAVGLGLKRYYPAHSLDTTPSRLQILLNILLHRRGTDRD